MARKADNTAEVLENPIESSSSNPIESPNPNAEMIEDPTAVVNTQEAEAGAGAEAAKKAYDAFMAKIAKVKAMNLTTKSAKIRALAAEGLTRSQIADAMKVRYQHVRNVLIQPVKQSSAAATPKKESKDAML